MNKGQFALNKNILILLVIIGAIVYFGYAQTGSLISCERTGPSRGDDLSADETITWGEYETRITASHLGELTGPFTEYDGYNRQTVCIGGEDYSWFLSNGYESSDALILESEFNHLKEGGLNYGATNFIKAEINLNKGGTIKIIYKNSGSGYDYPVGFGYLEVEGQKITTQGSYEFEVEKGPFSVLLGTSIPNSGITKSQSTAEITFTPEETTTEEQTPPEEQISEPITTELSFVDKINLWIDNLFNTIFGWFK